MKENILGLSLFANAGIAETYLSEIGFDVVVANEIDVQRALLYKHFHPDTNMIIGDIRNRGIKNEIYQECNKTYIDFIIATPPCQGMSSAGKMDPRDPRNHLITDAIEIIKKLKPKYVFIENVPEQLITSINYKNKSILIPDYIKISLEDYYTFNNDFIINAKDYGIPQSRERAIFLLTRKDQKRKWDFPKKENKILTLFDAIGHLPQVDPPIRDISNSKLRRIFPDFDKKYERAINISPYFKPLPHVYRQVYSIMHTPTGKSAFENNKKYLPRKSDGSYVKGFKNTYKRMSWDKPCNTITTYNRTIGSQENVHPGRLIGRTSDGTGVYSDPRVLTLYEILILFSLPTNWKIPPSTSENLIRTVIGEGIPPLLVKKIFLNLINSIKSV